MIFINITNFVLIILLEKDHSMIETRRLKNVVIFIQTILSFVLSRKIVNIYNDIAQKYGIVTVKDFRKYEKLEYKKNKLKLDIDFLNNCKQLGVYPKFLIFKLPNVSNKDALSIRKRLLHCVINKCNKELHHLSKELSLSKKIHNIVKQEIAAEIVIHSTKIVIYTDEGLQLTYITKSTYISMPPHVDNLLKTCFQNFY